MNHKHGWAEAAELEHDRWDQWCAANESAINARTEELLDEALNDHLDQDAIIDSALCGDLQDQIFSLVRDRIALDRAQRRSDAYADKAAELASNAVLVASWRIAQIITEANRDLHNDECERQAIIELREGK